MEERVAIRVKPATIEDCRAIYEWRVHPSARAVSRHKEFFPFSEHETWFAKALGSADKRIYVAWDGERVGQIRFDNHGHGNWEANVTVDPEKKGKGYGSKIVLESSKKMFQDTDAQVLVAEIAPSHSASIRIFEKAGYLKQGEKTNEYGDWIVLHLVKGEK